MAKAKKKADTKSKAGKGKKVVKNFQALWAEIGNRITKEVKAEKKVDQKAIFAKLNGDSQLQLKIVECAKGLIPANPAPPPVYEKAEKSIPGIHTTPSSLTGSSTKPSGSCTGDDFWSSCDSGSKYNYNNPRT